MLSYIFSYWIDLFLHPITTIEELYKDPDRKHIEIFSLLIGLFIFCILIGITTTKNEPYLTTQGAFFFFIIVAVLNIWRPLLTNFLILISAHITASFLDTETSIRDILFATTISNIIFIFFPFGLPLWIQSTSILAIGYFSFIFLQIIIVNYIMFLFDDSNSIIKIIFCNFFALFLLFLLTLILITIIAYSKNIF
ncbi:MAG: hypothetical protein ACOCQR_02865 [bacterium]